MIITNLSRKEKELLINALSNTIGNLKDSENNFELIFYRKMLETINETEPVDYPSPKLIKFFSKKLGGGFIEVFTMQYKVFKYHSSHQMKEHKREMIKKGFNWHEGEITREDKVINRELVITYTKPEN